MNPGSGRVNTVSGNWFGFEPRGRPAPNYTGLFVSRDSTDQLIRENLFSANVTGISVSANATLSSASGSNCIVGNGTGLKHSGAALDLDAEINYWGAANGPSGVASGDGDTISIFGTGMVDWTPWTSTPVDACALVFCDGFETASAGAWSGSVGGP